jgi:hypothetical protein
MTRIMIRIRIRFRIRIRIGLRIRIRIRIQVDNNTVSFVDKFDKQLTVLTVVHAGVGKVLF